MKKSTSWLAALLLLAGSLPVAGVFYSFQISDSVGKGIVVFLILASVWVWTIMLAKHLELMRAERVDRDFIRAFDRQVNPLEIFVRGPAHPNSPMAKVYATACVAVKREFESQASKQNRALSQIAPGVKNAFVRVTSTQGTNPFITYAVLNDGSEPGKRSGDGAYIPSEIVSVK